MTMINKKKSLPSLAKLKQMGQSIWRMSLQAKAVWLLILIWSIWRNWQVRERVGMTVSDTIIDIVGFIIIYRIYRLLQTTLHKKM